MRTKEDLNALKEEVETLNEKFHKLKEDELKQVNGGGTGETNNCPYGKTQADKDCNFIYHDRRCQYAKFWIECPYPYNIYDCEKGCGRFDDRKPEM